MNRTPFHLKPLRFVSTVLPLMLSSCVEGPPSPDYQTRDIHSYANPSESRVTHLELDLVVDFDARQLRGSCTLQIEGSGDLVLDTRDLTIAGVEVSDDGEAFREAPYELGAADAILGAPLTIARGSANRVRVEYSTAPGAGGLQWLDPPQTAGQRYPFLYSQSQAIQARTWIPLQDSPGSRVTYAARIRTPPELLAVMSAEMLSGAERTGDYEFRMRSPIPPYLIALAVGDLVFAPTGDRTGVYAEPSVVEAAAREFEDTESMMQAVESLYGRYRWGRYDILVLPPAFPFGGMENPMLTFVSPTVIAGDKSLVSLIAHELAHSWSGNLVTNFTWSDFWLNEGFTTYLEARIQEEVYGPERAAMEVALEVDALKEELEDLDEPDQVLHVNLSGRDPDEGVTSVPYVKGSMFLRTLEHAVGRDRFDGFLRGYFERFAFQSITTAQFANYLEEELLAGGRRIDRNISVEEWLEAPGLPEFRHEPRSAALEVATGAARQWSAGSIKAADLSTEGWTTQHWMQFVRELPDGQTQDGLADLDRAFGLTDSGNAEILTEWLKLAIRNSYAPADAALERFLVRVGRRKFLRPLYEQLMLTAEGRAQAAAIYAKARPGYHPITVQTIDEIVGWK